MTSFTEQELEAKLSLGWPTVLSHSRLSIAIVAELHLQLFSNRLGSDRIVVTSLTFLGHVTSLHDHTTDLDSP